MMKETKDSIKQRSLEGLAFTGAASVLIGSAFTAYNFVDTIIGGKNYVSDSINFLYNTDLSPMHVGAMVAGGYFLNMFVCAASGALTCVTLDRLLSD